VTICRQKAKPAQSDTSSSGILHSDILHIQLSHVIYLLHKLYQFHERRLSNNAQFVLYVVVVKPLSAFIWLLNEISSADFHSV